jgi:hypothetical protein
LGPPALFRSHLTHPGAISFSSNHSTSLFQQVPSGTGAWSTPAGGGSSGFTWSGLYLNQGSTTPAYEAPTSSGAAETVAAQAFLASPSACMVTSLTVNAIMNNASNPPAADTMAITLMKNEVPQTMTCSISSTTTPGSTYS